MYFLRRTTNLFCPEYNKYKGIQQQFWFVLTSQVYFTVRRTCISWVVHLMTIVYFYLYVSYEHQWIRSFLDSLLIDLYSLIRWWRSIIYGWIKVYLIHLTLYSLSFLDANWIMAGENLYIVLQCCWKHAIVILGDSMTGLMSTHRWIKLSSTLN